MASYRKRPLVIEAERWDGENVDALKAFAGEALDRDKDGRFVLLTLEGPLWLRAGDMVIRGVKGEFYPCRRDVFEATYEPVIAEGELA